MTVVVHIHSIPCPDLILQICHIWRPGAQVCDELLYIQKPFVVSFVAVFLGTGKVHTCLCLNFAAPGLNRKASLLQHQLEVSRYVMITISL